jgi:hypothetical protein
LPFKKFKLIAVDYELVLDYSGGKLTVKKAGKKVVDIARLLINIFLSLA